MVLHIIIKNFGKVESADIALNNLVVFVGNNNSGKTMVMQLIYGLRKELENFFVPVLGAKISDLNDQTLIRCDWKWFIETETKINKYLEENKQQIIERIYGIPIPVEEIKIALEGTKTTYFVSSVSVDQNRDDGELKTDFSINTLQYEKEENVKSYESRISNRDCVDDVVAETLKIVWKIILSGETASDSKQLFLPASRSGLQLLYKHYFAGNTEGNLVMPMKEFLRFLQLYSADTQLDEKRRALLEFGEEYLLQGRLVQKGEETFYVDGDTGGMISLHIASSMIHELTPFIKALSATQQIDWFYCDEVENSLHPLMQREMARWLIRMVNAGIHVIISSHSDTMASRLNNLLMLTHLKKEKADYALLSELDLKDVDLLRSDLKADVYEFYNGGQGKTIVKELEFMSHPMMGYDFQLFGSNLDKLYDEAEKITR